MRDVKLGEICAFTRGLTYKKSDEVGFSKNIVLRANNIDLSTNSLLLDDLRYIKDSIKIESEKLVKKNSLIICTASGSKSHLGKVALITEDFGYSFGGFMGQITPSKDCHHRFLFYIFTSPSFKDFLMGLTDGTNINNLKFTDIENYEVRLPKYEEQVKIVMQLDKTFAEIDSLEKNLQLKEEKTNQLLQSMLNAAFTNTEDFDVKVAKLGEVCNLIGGGTPSKANQDFYLGDINWATVRDLNKRWLENTEYKINKKAVQESSTNIIPSGNVVIATRVGLGKVVQLSHETAINQDLRALVPKKGVTLNSNYLFYWANSVSSKIVAAGKGATVQGVTLPFLKNLEIILPLPEKQEEIVNRLDKAFFEIDKLKNQISIEKDRISSLRQSILSNAFNFEEQAA